MATSTTKNTRSLDAATEQFKDLNDRLVDAGRKVGALYLDSYERTVDGVTSFEKRVAAQSNNELVSTVVGAHADLSRDLAKAYTAAARELIAA